MLTSIVFLLGLLVGSFLNVVIHRLPLMLQREWQGTASASPRYDLILPASHCSHCLQALRLWHNIPLLSYLLLRGRCAYCRAAISFRYPAVELLAGLSGVLLVMMIDGGNSGVFGLLDFVGLAALLLLLWCLIALAVIDLEQLLLPDSITLPLLWLGLLVHAFAITHDLGLVVSIQDAVIGAAAGYLLLWSVYWLFRLLTGKEGMGYGDFKLLAAIGAWLGWQGLLPVVLVSSLVGMAVGILLNLVRGRDWNTPLPYGVFLAAAGYLCLLGYLLGWELLRWEQGV